MTGRKRGVVQWENRSAGDRCCPDRRPTGTGRRASLYTDYTFAVWAGESDHSREGLFRSHGRRDSRTRRLIRAYACERFGPVRMVEARRCSKSVRGHQPSDRHNPGSRPVSDSARTNGQAREDDHVATLETLLASFGSSVAGPTRQSSMAESCRAGSSRSSNSGWEMAVHE